MNSGIRELLLEYIDDALDADDLEGTGDYVRSLLITEGIADWQAGAELQNLYSELRSLCMSERNSSRRMKMQAAIAHIETDYSDLIIERETGSLGGNN